MKKIFVIAITTLLLTSCGASKEQKAKTTQQLNVVLNELNSANNRKSDLVKSFTRMISTFIEEKETKKLAVKTHEANQEFIKINSKTQTEEPNTNTINILNNANRLLNDNLNILHLKVNEYPDVRDNRSYRDLLNQISGLESRIKIIREKYNHIIDANPKSTNLPKLK